MKTTSIHTQNTTTLILTFFMLQIIQLFYLQINALTLLYMVVCRTTSTQISVST